MKLSANKVLVYSFWAIVLVGVLAFAQQSARSQTAAKPALYNTAKAKLFSGKQIFSFTQDTFDPKAYCEKAKHYDYTWFEMQHSILEFRDIRDMIAACPHAGASPFIRLPDAQEWHIQHATDIGALGVIVPTVDDVSRSRDASQWSHYPPMGRRSAGAGLAATVWGPNNLGIPFRTYYRQSINDNILCVVMIETPTGVANAYDIAAVPGVDVVIIGNNDMSSFSGYPQTDEKYHDLIAKVHDEVLRAGKIFGQANNKYATGPYSKDSYFFQGGPSNDGYVPPEGGEMGAPKNEQ
jgi:2-keto-3-deoxy-L-rhamnonate aldolase RhmA